MMAADLTPIIDLIAERGTGPVRERRPQYVDLLPPCNHACPAGENIQAWLAEARAGRYREAWQLLVRDNPLPAVHGRVCYHPCEWECNRANSIRPCSIHAVERFLGDLATQHGWPLPIDAAPQRQARAGRRRGPERAFRRLPSGASRPQRGDPRCRAAPGGMMHFGIPAYRLPRAELSARSAASRRWACASCLNHRSTTCSRKSAAGKFDAVFLAIGAAAASTSIFRCATPRACSTRCALHEREHRRERPARPAGGGLRRRQHGDGRRTHRRRLGADEALIVYRRDRAHMPAQPSRPTRRSRKASRSNG